MRFLDWLRPGIKVKRWIMFGVLGLLLIFFGLQLMVRNRFYNYYYISYYIFVIITGVFLLYIAITQGMKAVIALVNKGYLNVSINSRKLESMIYEKRLLVKGPKIVVIGGGTGLSTMLRGLKYYTSNITAVVTVADDGGGSGQLRGDLGILPPGDIRNCILALADTEPLMEELLQYRFKDGMLKNQSFGNLFLAAMDGISGNFEEAVKKMSSVLAVTGRVVPVTLDDVVLKARLKNGCIAIGESHIGKVVAKESSPIDRVFIDPEDASAVGEAVEAILEADAIILGPGSLYTSVIPNLLIKDITSAIHKSKAIKMYVCNIMTQRGETDGYNVEDHLKAIFKHSRQGIVDYAIVNVGKPEEELAKKYLGETSTLVNMDEEKINAMGVKVIEGDFISVRGGLLRHNSDKLASILIQTIMEKTLLYDRKKIIEYFYLSERLKEKNKNRE